MEAMPWTDACIFVAYVLVLSHNEIEEIDISSLAGLSKLSLSHNNLHEIPDLKVCLV